LRGNNVDVIREFASSNGINFHQQAPGDYSIPFQENAFDVVTALSIVEHLHSSPVDLLNTVGRHLKIGGLVVIVMPNSVNFRKRLAVIFGRSNYSPVDELYYSVGEYRGHVREYTLSETKRIVELSGFDIVHASWFEHFAYDKLSGISLSIYLFLGKIVHSFRSGILVVAKKPENWAENVVTEEEYSVAVKGAVPASVA